MEDYWGIIYAIMKSLGINELEIEDKYLEITPNDIKKRDVRKEKAFEIVRLSEWPNAIFKDGWEFI